MAAIQSATRAVMQGGKAVRRLIPRPVIMQGGKAVSRLIPRPAKIFRLRRLIRFGLCGFLVFILLDILLPFHPETPGSRLIQARDGTVLRAYLSPDDKWRMHVRLDEVPAELREAIVAKEDRWFWQHPGVNPLSVIRATWGNIVSGKRESGASTITMQLARMLEPKPRTLWNKCKEVFRAFQLEWHYSKAEILEMYMGKLPYGGNVEGVKAASYLFFGRPPTGLSPAQSVLLAVVPNRPNSLRPDEQNAAAREARNKWLRRFTDEGIFPASQLNDALNEPIPQQRLEFPNLTPQFSEFIRRQNEEEVQKTTISPAVQKTAQELLANHVRRLRHSGISNGAVIVVDNDNMEVLAYCGSADFQDKDASGEVDGAAAIRSPGSTLKPFIYALAFDKGLISPKSRLHDLPAEFAGFSPVNYDQSFQGEVTAEHALRHSLNLPAVRLLQQVGLGPFLDGMTGAGFKDIARQRRQLGLSVALGGCGASLVQLVTAYSAFANEGILRSLQFVKGNSTQDTRVCSAEAAFLIAEILSGIQRPDLPAGFLERSRLPKVAWKTGTSFGRRDAWSIGFNPRYTIGVWMGNMDGSSVMEMSGSKTAVPLMLDLFNAIDYDAHKGWFRHGEKLGKRVVCAESGMVPSEACTQLSEDYFIAGTSPRQVCNRNREFFTDAEGKVQYCTACLPASGFIKQNYPIVHAELLAWMDRNKVPHPRPPAHNMQCEGVFHTGGPRIVSPVVKGKYYVEEGQELLLQASSEPGTSLHYWFANGEYVGSAVAGGKFFFRPEEGNVEIACMDDKGRLERVRVEVAGF